MKLEVKLIQGLIVAISFLIAGILLPRIKTANKILSSTEAISLINKGIHKDVLYSYAHQGSPNHFTTKDSILIFANGSKSKIYFKKRKSLAGKWRGESPNITIKDNSLAEDKTILTLDSKNRYCRTKNSHWYSISSVQYEEIEPYLIVNFNSIDKDDLHKEVLVNAKIKLSIPAFTESSGLGYENLYIDLNREIKAYGITKEEFLLLKKLRKTFEVPLGIKIFLYILAILIGYGAIVIYKEEKADLKAKKID